MGLECFGYGSRGLLATSNYPVSSNTPEYPTTTICPERKGTSQFVVRPLKDEFKITDLPQSNLHIFPYLISRSFWFCIFYLFQLLIYHIVKISDTFIAHNNSLLDCKLFKVVAVVSDKDVFLTEKNRMSTWVSDRPTLNHYNELQKQGVIII